MLMKLDDSFQGYIFDLCCIQEGHVTFGQGRSRDWPHAPVAHAHTLPDRASSGHVTGHMTHHFRSRDFLSREFWLLYLAPPPQIWLELSPYTTQKSRDRKWCVIWPVTWPEEALSGRVCACATGACGQSRDRPWPKVTCPEGVRKYVLRIPGFSWLPKGGRVCACATRSCTISDLVGPFARKWGFPALFFLVQRVGVISTTSASYI
jgi:hypothetical protein